MVKIIILIMHNCKTLELLLLKNRIGTLLILFIKKRDGKVGMSDIDTSWN